MHHRKSGRRLNRNSSHRKAMFRNMAVSMMRHELIKTTLAKAKELRRVVEPLITMAGKADSVANRRLAFSRLRDDAVVNKLFTVLGPRYKARPGGYLRVLKCGFRPGDNAPMAIVELVDRDMDTTPAEEKPATTAKAEKKPAAKAKAEKKPAAKADKTPAEDKPVTKAKAEKKPAAKADKTPADDKPVTKAKAEKKPAAKADKTPADDKPGDVNGSDSAE